MWKIIKILLVITLIVMVVPFINKTIDYTKEKTHKAKALGKTTVKFFKYLDKSKAIGKD